jgi:perosamine synthetase
MTYEYPVSRPSLTDLEESYVVDALRSGWVSSHGPYLERFEAEFSRRLGVGHTVATSSGTTALHLVLAAAGIGPGDEVIVPALTYVATANAVTYCGARVVLVDVLADTWCLDPDLVEASIGPRTRAVIAVDLYGHPADYEQLAKICAARGLLLIADAAESLGASVADRPVGTLADATMFSFYGNKVLTAGEGGCVTTSDAALADRLRLLRNQGMDPERRYYFPVIGYNYRLTNLAAALLCAQLDRMDVLLDRREWIVQRYERELAAVPQLHAQPQAPHVRRAPWLASFLVGPLGDHAARDQLATRLAGLGVETRPFFHPIPTLPPYQDAGRPPCPVAADLGRRGINLPTYPELGDADVAEIAARVRRAVA